MQITRTHKDDIVDVTLAGRLDGYWCDHLNATLAELLHEGHHHMRIDCAAISYLTSAGIGVLVRFYKQLERIHGTFKVVNPSAPVLTVLRLARLDTVLVALEDATALMPAIRRASRTIERDDIAFEVFNLDTRAMLTCRSIGTAGPLLHGAFGKEHCATFESLTPTFAVGVGAFGSSFDDCRNRFGELVSVGGATAYQPGDGTNVADYLLTGGGMGADIRILYGLACDGRFSHLLRFRTTQPKGGVGFS
jgi:anti-sigma B factor antagonist